MQNQKLVSLVIFLVLTGHWIVTIKTRNKIQKAPRGRPERRVYRQQNEAIADTVSVIFFGPVRNLTPIDSSFASFPFLPCFLF